MDYKVNFIFTKQGLMKYISHLDLMRLFMRSFRRADLPVKITQGFSPHIKLSLKRALKLGIESENEQATVILKQPVSPEEFGRRLNEQLPEGMTVTETTISY
jgi:radical SAM-linked protein